MINIDLVPIKYITGTHKYSEQYPTIEDFMWDIVSLGKKNILLESIDWIDDEKKEDFVSLLEKAEFIKRIDNKITILKTYWDGRCNQ